jgi:hypothetical protein
MPLFVRTLVVDADNSRSPMAVQFAARQPA